MWILWWYIYLSCWKFIFFWWVSAFRFIIVIVLVCWVKLWVFWFSRVSCFWFVIFIFAGWFIWCKDSCWVFFWIFRVCIKSTCGFFLSILLRGSWILCRFSSAFRSSRFLSWGGLLARLWIRSGRFLRRTIALRISSCLRSICSWTISWSGFRNRVSWRISVLFIGFLRYWS